MNPMKNGRVFAKKCLVRFLSANHLTIEACTWARQSNKQQKQHGPKKKKRKEERKRGGWRKPQDVSINQNAEASSTKNSSKGEPSGEREHKKSFLIPKVSVSASSMVAISRLDLRSVAYLLPNRRENQANITGKVLAAALSGLSLLFLVFTRGYA